MPEMLKTAIKKLYEQDWYYVERVLGGFIKRLEKKSEKGAERIRYEILKPLPTQDEFIVLMQKCYTSTAQGLYEEACSDIEELKGEIEDWKSAIEDNFSGTEKYAMLETALDSLENFNQQDWPDSIPDCPVVHIPPVPKIFRGRPANSRASRLEEACSKLSVVESGLTDQRDTHVEKMRVVANQIEDKKEDIDEKRVAMENKQREAAEIREAWETYENEMADHEEDKKEDPDVEEPNFPSEPISDAEALEIEAENIETEKDGMELDLSDFCKSHEVDDDFTVDDLDSAYDELIGEIENGRNEIEGVEFPGWSG